MNNWKNTISNSYFSILLIGFVSVLFITQLVWKSNNKGDSPRIITSDGIGYYYYLPNTFLSNKIKDQKPDNRFFTEVNGKGVNKYYVGTAVAMYPFFELGYFLADKGEEINGFESSYQKSISLAGLFYLLGGLLFLKAFLRQYKFKEWIISITLLLLFFGTNLMAYALLMPSMSHIYSFFFISGFLYFSKKLILVNNLKHLLFGTIFLAMIILIRPLNGIIIFAIPFLAGSWTNIKLLLSQLLKPMRLILVIVVLFFILFIQSYFWYLQCGEWIVWSYGKEGFYFLKPYIWEVLFSFRKGAFVYTPILALSVLGLILLIRKNKFQGWSLFLFFTLLVYLISSWWNWYYGPSFGQRPFVEFYGLSAILVAFSFHFIQAKSSKILLIGFSLVCIFLNLIQTYQYHNGIISSWDMNAKKYNYTFLKTSKKYKYSLGGNNDIMLYNADMNKAFYQFIDFEKEVSNTSLGNTLLDNKNTVSNYSNQEFNFDLTIPATENFVTSRGIYLDIEFDYKDLESSWKNDALFVVELIDSVGVNYRYGTFQMRDVPPVKYGKWIHQKYSIEIQEKIRVKDNIKIYIWNKGRQLFYIDNFEITVLAID